MTAKMINTMIDVWDKETFNLSSAPDHTHPAFYLVKKLAEKDKDIVITTILKRIEKETTFFAVILYDIIPLQEWPKFPKEVNGKADEVSKIWVAWGYEKGYLNV